MQSSIPLVVFSDLDGTLLDHETYSWAPAKPALKRLARLEVPVILASSKTADEIHAIQSDMGLTSYPAIIENGAGIFRSGIEEQGQPQDYAKLRSILDKVSPDSREHFLGFGDLSNEDVARATGLSQVAAASARTRSFSEPGLWSGSSEAQNRFLSELAKYDVTARAGGRFLTLSFGKTKKDRMEDVIALYSPNVTVALGDAPNDVEMLENSDYGFIVSNPHHPPLPRLKGEDDGRIERIDAPGPEGWNAAMMAILDRLELIDRG